MNTQGRPEAIKKSITLIVIIALLSISLNLFNLYDFRHQPGFKEALSTQLIFNGLYLLLLYKIWTGRHWARIMFTLWITIQLIYNISFYTRNMIPLTAFPMRTAASYVLIIIGIILMFTPASNAWFKAMSVKLKSAPDKD